MEDVFKPNAMLDTTVQKVPTGSPSRGGDVAVYIFGINQASLPTLFYSFLCLFLSLWPFQLYFIP